MDLLKSKNDRVFLLGSKITSLFLLGKCFLIRTQTDYLCKTADFFSITLSSEVIHILFERVESQDDPFAKIFSKTCKITENGINSDNEIF